MFKTSRHKVKTNVSWKSFSAMIPELQLDFLDFHLMSWNSLCPAGRPDDKVNICHHLIVEHD